MVLSFFSRGFVGKVGPQNLLMVPCMDGGENDKALQEGDCRTKGHRNHPCFQGLVQMCSVQLKPNMAYWILDWFEFSSNRRKKKARILTS